MVDGLIWEGFRPAREPLLEIRNQAMGKGELFQAAFANNTQGRFLRLGPSAVQTGDDENGQALAWMMRVR